MYQERRGLFGESGSLIDSLIRNGRYSWIKRLIIDGFRFFSAKNFVKLTCTIGPNTKSKEAIDFLEFLIEKRLEFDINDLIWIDKMKSSRSKDFKETVGSDWVHFHNSWL